MAAPTPGPWAVFDTHPTKACFYIDRYDQVGEHAIGEVAVIYTTADETKRANAALIAAAPDLVKVLLANRRVLLAVAQTLEAGELLGGELLGDVNQVIGRTYTALKQAGAL